MAEDLEDGEFWLPSQFLTDEDILMDFTGDVKAPAKVRVRDLCCSGESVTETESDEEELLAGLNCFVDGSTVADGLSNTKRWVSSGSPQSTLCGCRHSPTGVVSPVPAPPSNGGGKNTPAWNQIYMAAGEVARLKVKTEEIKGTGFFDSSRGPLGRPMKDTSRPVQAHNGPVDLGVSCFRMPSLQELQQLVEFQRLRQQHEQRQSNKSNVVFQPMQKGINRVSTNGIRGAVANRPLGLPLQAWWPSQKPPESTTQAVFQVKRESVGTGVFLPRRVDVSQKYPEAAMNHQSGNRNPRRISRRSSGNKQP